MVGGGGEGKGLYLNLDKIVKASGLPVIYIKRIEMILPCIAIKECSAIG